MGHISVRPSFPVLAGSSHSWCFTYTAGASAMRPGDALRMDVPYGFSSPKVYPGGWPPPVDHPNQGPDPIAPGYLEASASRRGTSVGILLHQRPSPKGWLAPWYAQRTALFLLRGEALRAGDTLEIIFGSLRSGSPGATAPIISQTAAFGFSIVRSSLPEPIRLPSVAIEVLPGPVEFATAVAPSILAPGERAAFRGTFRDLYGNPARCSFSLSLKEGNAASTPVKGEGTAFHAQAAPPSAAGVSRRVLHFDAPAIASIRTNPTLVEESPSMRLFWGDIHGHTSLADGLGTVEEYFLYARELAQLDFSSLGEHDFAFTAERWDAAKEVTTAFNEPGRFVTLYGYEWSGQNHVNVYYNDDSGPMIHSASPESNTVSKLLRLLPREGVLVIPHQHFGADWNQFDPGLMRVTEIYSEHGSSEFKGCALCLPTSTVNDEAYVDVALKAGRRIGFIASSDSHCGRPGYSNWLRSRRQYRGGLAACFAPELTRDAIWDSLRSRRCYATTGERILVRFWLNDSFMGDETGVAKGESVAIEFEVYGTAELESVELVKNGEVLRSWNCPGWDLVQVLQDTLDESSYYYLRIRQLDGHMAWTSPIWADPVD